MNPKYARIALFALIVASPATTDANAHMPPECQKWLHRVGEQMTRLGQQTAEMVDALPYRRRGRYYTADEVGRYADLTGQAMGTVQYSYLLVLRSFQCTHPGLIPPKAFEALRPQGGARKE